MPELTHGDKISLQSEMCKALGGPAMKQSHCVAMCAAMIDFGVHDTTSAAAALIASLGGENINAPFLKTVLATIAASPNSPHDKIQMFGDVGESIDPWDNEHRSVLLDALLNFPCTPRERSSLFKKFGEEMGGDDMLSTVRDEILDAIQNQYASAASHRMRALEGLTHALGGENISPDDADALIRAALSSPAGRTQQVMVRRARRIVRAIGDAHRISQRNRELLLDRVSELRCSARIKAAMLGELVPAGGALILLHRSGDNAPLPLVLGSARAPDAEPDSPSMPSAADDAPARLRK